MIIDAAKNIHLRKQATKLLLFYTDQAEGFSPVLALICARTGISKNKVSEIRKKLVQRGLICYDREFHKIYISWNRLQAFAMLEKPLLLTRGKHTFYPFEPELQTPKRKKHKRHAEQHRLLPVPLTLEQKRQLEILEAMPPDVYREMISIRTE